MAKLEKSNLYLLSIVGIVAVVGIVVLVLNGGGSSSLSLSSDDLSGEALKVKSAEVEKLLILEKRIEELEGKLDTLTTVNEADNPLCPAPCGSPMAEWCGQVCD